MEQRHTNRQGHHTKIIVNLVGEGDIVACLILRITFDLLVAIEHIATHQGY